jgi:hypothetical protein
MLRRLIILIAVVASGLLAVTSASATAVTEKIPFDFVLAPEEGCGEAIHLTGTLLTEFSFTESSSGNVEVGFHFNPQGITGVGLTTGAIYHATGETLGTTTIRTKKGGISDTFVNNFKIIGEGSAPNFLQTDVIHLTVNAKGEVTASVEQSTIRCV